jgi:hypothetical protein
MLIDRKLIKSLGLALSLPSTIIIMALVSKELVESGVLSKSWGIILFLAVILNTLFMMVYYAFRKKDKS